MIDFESLLQKFFNGATSVEEDAILARFIDEGETGVFDEYCRRKWGSPSLEISSEVKERIRSSLLEQIQLKTRRSGTLNFRGVVRRFAKLVGVAAVVLLAVLAIWHLTHEPIPETFIIVAERGQKSTITLPDGSRVWLNSASSISYTSDYNTKERNVLLQGEAYFDVAENPEIPFIVHASGLSVEALGTRFNVRAYVEDECIVTTLVEGQVKMTSGDVSEVLFPEQESSFDKRTGQMTKSRVKDVAHMIPWIRNEIYFAGDSLSEIAALLERMYNVTVMFDDREVGEYKYTGLVRNNSLQNVLELIATTSPVDYRMNADTVKFSRNE